ncbi:DUF724 domain-containing protein 3-like [Apium graveolens]|uniref:DUF724 domain-containing protein 3-like n=1 Tax=Apium graveolens TaxID=4045 RepID=UPI003D792E51
MVDHNFTIGSRVEVRSDDEGFRGACYVATVTKNPKDNKCQVVYDHLMESEGKDSNPLEETVDVSCLRPLPPLDKGGYIIKLYDIVDAYHRDGWWKGQVIEILEEGNFLVYFQNPPDELIVHKDHLRLHLDWIHGKWQKPKLQSQIYKMISQGTEVEVTFESENYNVWHTGRVLKVEGNKFLVKYRFFGVDDKPEFRTEFIDSQCIRPVPPPVEEQEFDVLHKVEAYYRFCWWTGVIRRILRDRKYVVLVTQSKNEMECNHLNLRPRLDWIDGKWTTTSQNIKLLAIKYESFTSYKRKSTPGILRAGKYCRTTTGEKNDAAVCVDEANMPVNEELGASSETHVKQNQKKQMRNFGNIEELRGTKRTPSKKRGRLEKISLEEQIGKDNLMLMKIDKEPDEDDFMLSCKDYKKLIVAERKVLNHLRRRKLLSGIPNISLIKKQTNKTGTNTRVEKLPNESMSGGHEKMKTIIHLVRDQENKLDKLRKEWLSNGHGEKSKSVDNSSQQQGVTTNIPIAEDQENETVDQQIDDHNIKGQLLIDDPLHGLNDDLPLLSGALLVSDMFATIIDGEAHSQKSSAVDTKDMVQFPLQNNIADIGSGELGTPSAIISCGSLKNEKVPFIKCSPIWKSVESMEIYRKTEQKPHFSLLSKCREEAREGLAIGQMIIFSTVVEKTSKLTITDPSTVIKSYLQTVADLEKQGFKVEPVRARLMMLLAKKEKKQKLEAEYRKIEDQITNKVLEKDELRKVIIHINQKIEKLAEKLNEVESWKVMKEDEISTLQSKQENISENARSVKDEFESIAGCPL